MSKQIVVLALLTQDELDRLGPQFSRAYPIDKAPCLGELLHAIDEADRVIWRERDRSATDGNVDKPPLEVIHVRGHS